MLASLCRWPLRLCAALLLAVLWWVAELAAAGGSAASALISDFMGHRLPETTTEQYTNLRQPGRQLPTEA